VHSDGTGEEQGGSTSRRVPACGASGVERRGPSCWVVWEEATVVRMRSRKSQNLALSCWAAQRTSTITTAPPDCDLEILHVVQPRSLSLSLSPSQIEGLLFTENDCPGGWIDRERDPDAAKSSYVRTADVADLCKIPRLRVLRVSVTRHVRKWPTFGGATKARLAGGGGRKRDERRSTFRRDDENGEEESSPSLSLSPSLRVFFRPPSWVRRPSHIRFLLFACHRAPCPRATRL
jgi:hypothetical protein